MTERMLKLKSIVDLVYKLILLNLIWLIMTMCGGIIFGIIPSSICLAEQIQKILTGEESTIKNFLSSYKAKFIGANKKYILLTLLFVCWIIQFLLFFSILSSLYFITTGILLIMILTYASTSYKEIPDRNAFKYTVGIMVINLKFNFYLITIGLLIIYATFTIKGLWMFLSISAFAYFFEKGKKTLYFREVI